MEVETSSISEGQISAMKEDVSSTVRKRRILMAFMPMDIGTLVPFISHVISEASKERKRCLIVCPPGKVSIMRDLSLGASSSVVGIDPSDMRCQLAGSQTHASDVSLHCFTEECMEGCQFQHGFSVDLYRSLKQAAGSFKEVQDRAFLDAGMCPARTLLDIACESNVIVADHAFLFSRGSDLVIKRIGIDPGNTIVAMMDPMTCIEQIWDGHSMSLRAFDLQVQAWPLHTMDPREVRVMELLFDNMRQLIQGLTEESGQIERKALIDGLRKDASEEGLSVNLPEVTQMLRGHYSSDMGLSINERSQLRYLEAFIDLWYHQHSTAVRHAMREPEPSITVSLIAPQVLTSTLSSDYHSVIVFGDTVYPHDVFVRLLGLTLNKVNNRTYVDRGFMEGLTVAAFTDVDTSMRLRLDQRQDDQYPVLASHLLRLAERKGGSLVAIFPSYIYLERTLEALRDKPGPSIVHEYKGMRKEDREGLIAEAAGMDGGIVLAVQNGLMAKAFETGAIKASTAVIVGLQFNPPTFESNQMKLYFNDNYGSSTAETISRVLPAAQKAMRLVNAQMYSPAKDRLAVLMDRRYHDRRNMDALPPFWDIKFISNPERFPLEKLGVGDG